MRWSVKIARIAGTEIRLHITFLIFLAWIGFAYYQAGGREAAVTGLVFLILLFLSVLLHELGHVITARQFGIHTPDITLLPIGGVARLRRMPTKPLQEIAVALAGPAVNVLIAALLILLTPARLSLRELLSPAGGAETTLTRLATVNLWLVLFNLLPAFPMDGGRVLRALIAMRTPYPQATRIAAGIGQGFAFLFGFLGLFGNPMLIFIALFLYLGASQEAAVAGLRDVSEWLSVSDAMVTEFSVLSSDSTVADAVEALLRTSQHEFPVVDGAGRVLGMLTRDDMIRALQTGGPDTPVQDVMRRDVPQLAQNASLEDAFETMQESDSPALPVVDSRRRLAGILTVENVGELMMIRSVSHAARNLGWRRPATLRPHGVQQV
jgi:Zn-dependent protease/CBS domain-containing protein